MEDRQEYIDKFAKQLKEWDSDLRILKEKINMRANNAKADLQKEMDNLESERNILRLKLQKMKDAGADVWKDMLEGTEKNWAEFKEKLTRFSGMFER